MTGRTRVWLAAVGALGLGAALAGPARACEQCRRPFVLVPVANVAGAPVTPAPTTVLLIVTTPPGAATTTPPAPNPTPTPTPTPTPGDTPPPTGDENAVLPGAGENAVPDAAAPTAPAPPPPPVPAPNPAAAPAAGRPHAAAAEADPFKLLVVQRLAEAEAALKQPGASVEATLRALDARVLADLHATPEWRAFDAGVNSPERVARAGAETDGSR